MELEIKKRKNSQRGFTLVELIIALAVFSIVITIVIGSANSVFRGQRKAFAMQNAQESSRFILEVMAKEIRMSTINTGGGVNLTILNISNSDGQIFDYQFDNTNKRLLRNGQVISPSNIGVTGNFHVSQYVFPSDPERKLATITMKIEVVGEGDDAIMNLQNTISPRGY